MVSNRLKQLVDFLEQRPDDSFILFAIAKEYEKHNAIEEAMSYYLRLRKAHPNYVGTYYHLGKLYEQNGDISTAFGVYKAGVEVAREAGDQHSLSELMGAKLELGDDDDFE
jgi:tetratricopeptide (TPR) repeat protein